MKRRLLLFANGALFCAAVLILGTMQTSLWFQIFGYFPAPSFWLCVIVFIGLYRPLPEATILIYASCFVISTMTVMPLGLIMIAAMGVGLAAKFVKQRIYWPGPGYVMIVCGCGSLLFHVLHWLASLVFEERSLASPEVGDWLIEALLTPLVAPAVHSLLWRFDRLTAREQPVEAGTTA